MEAEKRVIATVYIGSHFLWSHFYRKRFLVCCSLGPFLLPSQRLYFSTAISLYPFHSRLEDQICHKEKLPVQHWEAVLSHGMTRVVGKLIVRRGKERHVVCRLLRKHGSANTSPRHPLSRSTFTESQPTGSTFI